MEIMKAADIILAEEGNNGQSRQGKCQSQCDASTRQALNFIIALAMLATLVLNSKGFQTLQEIKQALNTTRQSL